MLTYPVLMAADILIHKADYVPVGKDQEQHLEMTRTFATRFNHVYNTNFLPQPEAFNFGEALIKVPGLDGTGKMSKSDSNEHNAIFLQDEPSEIVKKMKKAKTDAGPTKQNQKMPEEIANLFQLMSLVSSQDTYQDFVGRYNDLSIRYGDLKLQIANDMISYLAPIKERIETLRKDETYLKEVAEIGAKKARENAQKTITEMRKIIGINYF